MTKNSRFFIQLDFEINQNQLELHMTTSGNCEIPSAASYNISTFEKIQETLIENLEYYQNEKSSSNLKELVVAGEKNYKYFFNKLDANAQRCWSSMIKYANHFNVSLEIRFPPGISFPFGLLYSRKSKEIKWDSKKNIFDGFLGTRFSIRKLYKRNKMRLHSPIFHLADKGSPVKVVHALDDALSYGRSENRNWSIAGFVDNEEKLNKDNLINIWNSSSTSPHIIHCSSHLFYDDAEKDYFLTLSSNEKVYVREIVSEVSHRTNRPPLLFLNTCNSGLSMYNFPENFVMGLFPNHALGFVATLCKVNDQIAYKMSYEFYQNFFSGKTISDSLDRAKSELIYSDNELSALSYSIWEVCPYLFCQD